MWYRVKNLLLPFALYKNLWRRLQDSRIFAKRFYNTENEKFPKLKKPHERISFMHS